MVSEVILSLDYIPLVCVGMHTQSLQLCLTLSNAMDCSLPGSSVHGNLQTRILEWVAIPYSWPRDWTCVSCIAGGYFTTELPEKLYILVAQRIQNPPAMWETWVPSLGWEDTLVEGMATHSSMGRGASWVQSIGSQRVGHDRVTKHSTQHWYIVKYVFFHLK